jgi:hypothetical protein
LWQSFYFENTLSAGIPWASSLPHQKMIRINVVMIAIILKIIRCILLLSSEVALKN